MHVIATAGHVDHGKSTLVRALTGTEPDRLEEERRRGLSIELGYAWTRLDGVGDVAFVDVPGHERFVSTMLSGVGPVPAVLFVVAADDPWMPQAAEHLAALDALGVRHGIVAVSRIDLADPGPATGRVGDALAGTSLEDAPVVPVSGLTGTGLGDLRARLAAMVRALPAPAPDTPVRLWVDRRFTRRGAGTVVTATLTVGTVRPGDVLGSGATTVRVRSVQTLGRPVDSVTGPARVALNLASGAVDEVDRGDVLVTPDGWWHTDVVDVLLRPGPGGREHPPERPMLHIGAASMAVHARPLSADIARLRLGRPLPLHVGDRALVRDPGGRQVWGVTVLDPAPPPLVRRGDARRRAQALDEHRPGRLDAEVSRRGVVQVELLRQIGATVDDTDLGAGGMVVADGWLMSAARATSAAREVADAVREHEASSPLAGGLPLHVLAERLGLPSVELVRSVVHPPLRLEAGRVSSGSSGAVPEWLREAAATVCAELADSPFAAPVADRLRDLGLDDRSAAAAAKAGLLLRPAPGILLPPDADRLAARLLAELPQPFTASQARTHLGTSRRVVLPLLDHLDRSGLTRRHRDDRREVTGGRSGVTDPEVSRPREPR